MRITRVACALLGNSPIIRVVTDEGIDGFGQIEHSKPFVAGLVPFFEQSLLGLDPTDVERCMIAIRRLGGNKPWGAVVSAIEMALWDTFGKAAGLPVHKLLGGKIRDAVRVYNGPVRASLGAHNPEDYARAAEVMMKAPERFTIIKEGVGYHGFMSTNVPGYMLGTPRLGPRHPNSGPLTEKGLRHTIACVAAMKEVLGEGIGLALDMGPGHTLSDSVRLAQALEPLGILWAEDMLSGDYTPWSHAKEYRLLTDATSTPIHTGEQLYLRHQFRELIETNSVNVIGPDPADVGGLAELKWIAEHANLHGIQIAPHGVLDGIIGLAALVQVSATLPENFIAFEYTIPEHDWWYEITEGFGPDCVRDGFIDVLSRPGLGIRIDPDSAARYLRPQDANFFDWKVRS